MGIAASSILKEELSGDLASWIDCASACNFSSSSFKFSQKKFAIFEISFQADSRWKELFERSSNLVLKISSISGR